MINALYRVDDENLDTDGMGNPWAKGFEVYRLVASIRNLGSGETSIASSENCRVRILH